MPLHPTPGDVDLSDGYDKVRAYLKNENPSISEQEIEVTVGKMKADWEEWFLKENALREKTGFRDKLVRP